MILSKPSNIILIGAAVFTIAMSSANTGGDYWVPVVERNTNLTVLIRTSMEGKTPGFGTGVIIAPGRVLTAKHILPSEVIRKSGDYLIDGLIGWSKPSMDFSLARKLQIDYVSNRYDFAILHFESRAASRLSGPQGAFANTVIAQGQDVLVMGYPGGGNLICTQGLASGEAADGKYATSAAVGIGNSGGPVFGTSGALIGILLEGAGRDSDGTIHLGYFLTSSVIAKDLVQNNIENLSTAPKPSEHPLTPLQTIQFAYPVDDEKTNHEIFSATGEDFQHLFHAQKGFAITSATFVGQSVNHVTNGPQFEIVDNGNQLLVRYTLQSGPIYDQWRGWIVGSIVTTQQRR